MKMKFFPIALLFIILPLLSSAQTTNPVNDNRGYSVKVGEMAPDFEIELLSGEKIKLSSLRGKIVMLQFTASWCSVCRKEMPHIESRIWQKNKGNKNFVLYGIDLKESAGVTKEFANTMNITYPITLDINGDKFALYTEPGAGVTRNIIIDKTGKIIMLTRLYDEAEFESMVKLIEEKLSE
jgi:peroxiredoxin